MAMTREEMLEFQARENRKQGLRRGPTPPQERIAPQPTPESVRLPPADLRGTRERNSMNQADLIKEYEALGSELTAPNRTADTVRTATARRAAILGQLRRDEQGRVIQPQAPQPSPPSYADAEIPPNIDAYETAKNTFKREVGNAASRVMSSDLATNVGRSVNYIGDRIANRLTGGRVDARQASTAGGGEPEKTVQVQGRDGEFYEMSEAENLALDAEVGRRNLGLRGSGGGAAAAPGSTIYQNADGSYTNIRGDNQREVQLGDSVTSQSGIGTPELRAYADIIRNRWANNIAAGGRRMGGGAATGAISRRSLMNQINRIHNAADKRYDEVIARSGNPRAAERAANSIRSRADSLLAADRNAISSDFNQVRREENATYRDVQAAAQAQRRTEAGLALEQEARKAGNEQLAQIATVNDGEGGSFVDYDGLAIASDLLGIDPRNPTNITNNATALRGLINMRRELVSKLNYLPDAAEMRRIMDEAAGASNLEWEDAFKKGDINLLDVLLSNMGLGPSALRLGTDTAFTYSPRNVTRGSQERFMLRDRDRNR